jgi:hypothetical protein
MRSARSAARRSWSLECWIPAEDLADLSEGIAGLIDVVAEVHRAGFLAALAGLASARRPAERVEDGQRVEVIPPVHHLAVA